MERFEQRSDQMMMIHHINLRRFLLKEETKESSLAFCLWIANIHPGMAWLVTDYAERPLPAFTRVSEFQVQIVLASHRFEYRAVHHFQPLAALWHRKRVGLQIELSR